MQEKVLLEVIPGIPFTDEFEDLSPTEPKLNTFAESHRSEANSIIAELPSYAEDEAKFEPFYERFITVLDLYQEQPTLLDGCMHELVSNILSHVTLFADGQTKFDNRSAAAFKLLFHLSKVRGYKPFLAFLSHEIHYLEQVLYTLEHLCGDFHSSYILLLWMVILCKNPFNLNRLNPRTDDPLYTDRRIIDIALSYLSRPPIDKCYPVAALLLAIVACRAEACSTLLPSLVENSVCVLKNSSEKSSNNVALVGNLYVLVAVFKQARREDLLNLAPSVLESVACIRNFDGMDLMVKKLVTKLVQRVGMVLLKPKIASWRYKRGNRLLTYGQLAADEQSKMDTDDNVEDDDYDTPQKELEAVLDTILKALRDCDTAVRWSAAKGIGRVASRLPKSLAEDVVRSVLTYNFNNLSGCAAWHGGCLAIAELARRGYLTVDLLPEVIVVLRKALTFEEPQGAQAVGANVRDAACYISWALARAFRPSDLAEFVEEIAASLVCVALFDREINVRRAASAAFQENVGRQGTFPNGIDILTKIDYFAVGQRHRSYSEISKEVAMYSRYSLPIVEHLLHKKITHWDETIRFLAAEALRQLASICGHLIVQQVPLAILPLITHRSPVSRQGGILALCGALSGLKACGMHLDEALCKRVAQIPGETYAICEKKGRATGGALIRRAVNTFVRLMSSVIPFYLIPIESWLRSIELNIIDENDEMRGNAAIAAAHFFQFIEEPEVVRFLASRVQCVYISRLLCADTECHRQGVANLLGALPANVLAVFHENAVPLFEDVVDALINVVSRPGRVDALWAFGRKACVEALTHIALTVGIDNISDSGRFIDCIIGALNDYTISRQGDVGRFVREGAMRSLAMILPKVRANILHRARVDEAICKIIQQSCEKIDAVRACAADVMCELLCGHLDQIAEKETLCKVYLHNLPPAFTGDPSPYKYVDWHLKSCFARLALLLMSAHYAYHSLSGFIISAGGLTESTLRSASEAVFGVLSLYRDSVESMEGFLHNLSSIVVECAGVRRVIHPLLCFLDQLFCAQLLVAFEADPDSSPALTKIVNFVARTATLKNNIHFVRLAVTVLCHLLHFNSNSHIWRKAASQVVRTLRSSCPDLRRSTAEQLYECLATECVVDDEMGRREELLDLVANTKWQTEDKGSTFADISISIAHLLNVP